MAQQTAVKAEAKRPGPASLFRGKVIARRSALLTGLGNAAVDELRADLGKALGRPRPLSIGDVFELLVHKYGKKLTAEIALQVAEEINAQTEKAA